MKYAEVALNVNVRQTFHYHIPSELEDVLQPGHLVRVGFRTGVEPGIVIALADESEFETKPILELFDTQPVVTKQQLEVAFWISERYLAPPGMCLWLWLPPGLVGKRTKQLRLLNPNALRTDSLQQKIIDLLKKRGSLRNEQIKQSLKDRSGAREGINALLQAEVIAEESFLAPPALQKKTKMLRLAIMPDQIPKIARHLGKTSSKADLLEMVAATPDDPIGVDDALRIAGLKSKSVLNRLEQNHLILIEKTERGEQDLIFLNIPPESVDEVLIDLRKGEKYLRILQYLAETGQPVEHKQVYKETQATNKHIDRLVEDGLVAVGEPLLWRDSLADRDYIPTIAPQLTPEQQQAWSVIEERMKQWVWDHSADPTPTPESGEGHQHRRGAAFLLHGVTGSGKTEIYLSAIELALAQGRQAIFLVPEIALTPQTIRRVAERFPGQVAVVHSHLKPGERYDTWQRARMGAVSVIVGTRSALFTPLPDVGLVILDEEHDHSYKQSPPIRPPHYHTRDVARKIIEQNNGILILGSATPDLDSFYQAQHNDLPYLHLPSRIMGHRRRILEQSEREGVTARYHPMTEDAMTIDLPPVQVVDMRSELKAGNRSMFSLSLQEALDTVLQRGEQAMLYLNRRGQSTYVFCRDCGYVAGCDHCDTPMTYHRSGEAMRCHHCGARKPVPSTCPACRSERIKFFGAGTQHVEGELHKRFPKARFVRWDADTANKPELHEAILGRFLSREVDVMIGTQMIAKGLDLPLVTLVGVVSADMGLALPDFRAGERVFQLLTQVAGRAGRGVLGGQVILQTYQPEHYAVAAASQHDYAGFYRQEIAYRRELGYPPFRRLIRIVFRYRKEHRAQEEAARAATTLRHQIETLQLTGTELIGPAPCFFNRLHDHFRWHILLRGPNPIVALEDIEIRSGWQVDIDPVNVL